MSRMSTQVLNIVSVALGIVGTVMAYKWAGSFGLLALEDNTPLPNGRKVRQQSCTVCFWRTCALYVVVAGLLFRLWAILAG